MAKTLIYRRTPLRTRLLLALLMMACVPAPFISLALAAPRSAPVVYMPFTQRDFGDLFVGERIDQAFPLNNDGDAPLELEYKSLTGQSMPSLPNHLRRASAVRAGHERGEMLRPVAMHLAAPS